MQKAGEEAPQEKIETEPKQKKNSEESNSESNSSSGSSSESNEDSKSAAGSKERAAQEREPAENRVVRYKYVSIMLFSAARYANIQTSPKKLVFVLYLFLSAELIQEAVAETAAVWVARKKIFSVKAKIRSIILNWRKIDLSVVNLKPKKSSKKEWSEEDRDQQVVKKIRVLLDEIRKVDRVLLVLVLQSTLTL